MANPSLATTLFEELYGHDENALAEMMDNEGLSPDARILATELLIGAKNLSGLDKEDRALLNHMAHYASSGEKIAEVHQPQTKPKLDEDFDNQ